MTLPITIDPKVLAEALKVLGHPIRLRIIGEIFSYGDPARELSVTDIYRKLGISQDICSQHLIKMRDRGILFSRKQGVKVYYGADPLFKEINNTILAILPA